MSAIGVIRTWTGHVDEIELGDRVATLGEPTRSVRVADEPRRLGQVWLIRGYSSTSGDVSLYPSVGDLVTITRGMAGPPDDRDGPIRRHLEPGRVSEVGFECRPRLDAARLVGAEAEA